MIRILLWLICFCFCLNSYSQQTFTAKKGSRWFPLHYHAVITVNSDTVHYQLFNHWYSHSYAQYRDIILPVNQLDSIQHYADSLTITIDDDKVMIVDEKYNFKKRIRHQRLCASVSTMRKVSFADSLAQNRNDLRHFLLYEHSDLDLSEDEFRQLVLKNFVEIQQSE